MLGDHDRLKLTEQGFNVGGKHHRRPGAAKPQPESERNAEARVVQTWCDSRIIRKPCGCEHSTCAGA
jgi:hypothetical protein